MKSKTRGGEGEGVVVLKFDSSQLRKPSPTFELIVNGVIAEIEASGMSAEAKKIAVNTLRLHWGVIEKPKAVAAEAMV